MVVIITFGGFEGGRLASGHVGPTSLWGLLVRDLGLGHRQVDDNIFKLFSLNSVVTEIEDNLIKIRQFEKSLRCSKICDKTENEIISPRNYEQTPKGWAHSLLLLPSGGDKLYQLSEKSSTSINSLSLTFCWL